MNKSTSNRKKTLCRCLSIFIMNTSITLDVSSLKKMFFCHTNENIHYYHFIQNCIYLPIVNVAVVVVVLYEKFSIYYNHKTLECQPVCSFEKTFEWV